MPGVQTAPPDLPCPHTGQQGATNCGRTASCLRHAALTSGSSQTLTEPNGGPRANTESLVPAHLSARVHAIRMPRPARIEIPSDRYAMAIPPHRPC